MRRRRKKENRVNLLPFLVDSGRICAFGEPLSPMFMVHSVSCTALILIFFWKIERGGQNLWLIC